MKTSKKEKKFVVVYRRWGKSQVHEFTCNARTAQIAIDLFENQWKDHESRIGYYLPCDIISWRIIGENNKTTKVECLLNS